MSPGTSRPALTLRTRLLLAFLALALIPTAGGVVMGLAGLLGWHVHPEILARLLS